jgi:hypothetical protein
VGSLEEMMRGRDVGLPHIPDSENLLTSPEVSVLFGITEIALRRWRMRGAIPFEGVPRKKQPPGATSLRVNKCYYRESVVREMMAQRIGAAKPAEGFTGSDAGFRALREKA